MTSQDTTPSLSGRLIGWNALAAAIVAAALIAASMVQLRSGEALTVGAAPADAAPALEAAMPVVAATPAQGVTGGLCETVSGSGAFRLTAAGTVEVPGFDASLGTLDSVNVTTTVGLQTGGSYTNVLVTPFPFTVLSGADFMASITGPGIAGASAAGLGGGASQTVAPGETVDLNIGQILGEASEPATDTAAYIGGTVSFPVTSAGSLLLSAGGDTDATIRTDVTATVEVTYCYTPPPAASSIIISKAVNAGAGATVPIFDFTIDCEGGFTTTAGLSSGEVTVAVDVPDGTTCTVTEAGVDTSRWSTEVNGACSASVAIVTPGRADFTNTLKAGSETPLGACGP